MYFFKLFCAVVLLALPSGTAKALTITQELTVDVLGFGSPFDYSISDPMLDTAGSQLGFVTLPFGNVSEPDIGGLFSGAETFRFLRVTNFGAADVLINSISVFSGASGFFLGPPSGHTLGAPYENFSAPACTTSLLAGATCAIHLRFFSPGDTNSGRYNDFLVVDYDIAAVPLPASFPMLLIGLTSLGFLARRRRQG